MRLRRGPERWESACSLLGPGRFPEAVAGWDPEQAAGSGSPQRGRRWSFPRGASGELQVPGSCWYAVRKWEKVVSDRYVKAEPGILHITSDIFM